MSETPFPLPMIIASDIIAPDALTVRYSPTTVITQSMMLFCVAVSLKVHSLVRSEVVRKKKS